MTIPKRVAVGGLLGWARKRRFPTLLLFTGGLFALDVIVPDFIPFAEESGLLQQLNCGFAQGYLWSRPLPPQQRVHG